MMTTTTTASRQCGDSITDCAWADLSSAEEEDACDLITASIDEEAGTMYECTEGPNEGLFLTVESSATCVSHSYSAACPITVGQTIDCFQAAKDAPCTAFAEDGDCGALFAAGASCQ